MAESAALAQFNKSWAELSDWLSVLDNMVQNKRVVVADLEDINDNIALLKVSVARKLDFYYIKKKKSQLSRSAALCNCVSTTWISAFSCYR